MTYVVVHVIQQDNKTGSMLIWGSHSQSDDNYSVPSRHHWLVRVLCWCSVTKEKLKKVSLVAESEEDFGDEMEQETDGMVGFGE